LSRQLRRLQSGKIPESRKPASKQGNPVAPKSSGASPDSSNDDHVITINHEGLDLLQGKLGISGTYTFPRQSFGFRYILHMQSLIVSDYEDYLKD